MDAVKETTTTSAVEEGNDVRWVSLELRPPQQLPGSTEAFDLETAVCSHGLFMMAPNRWDPLSESLTRPLRLREPHGSEDSVTAVISQRHGGGVVHVSVRAGTRLLSPGDEEALLAQVKRMLRLSESDERKCREFREVHGGRSSVVGLGRVFRSPSLFEDMVKCILLCNCSWPRTLSMAQSLCDLQLELRTQSMSLNNSADFIPKTPSAKEVKKSDALEFSNASYYEEVGNFPSPLELSKLDEDFLSKRCKLGYRAKRILGLSRDIVEGRLHLRRMEETCEERSLSCYSELDEQLKQIHGFGPFTRANVLMCMGFYHIVPSDSETIRHLKQVHGKISSVKTIERDVQNMYSKYEPFQFLAYWSELWHFYETRFGKFSEMPCSEYKLMTASNMRTKASHQNKRKRTTFS